MEAYTGTPDPFESLNGLQIVVLVFTFLLMVMSTLVIYYGEAHTTKFGKLNILMEKTTMESLHSVFVCTRVTYSDCKLYSHQPFLKRTQ